MVQLEVGRARSAAIKRLWTSMIFVICLLALAGTSRAITYERMTTDDQTRILVLKGEFVFEDDVAVLRATVTDFQPNVITFRSGGGNVDAAIRIGRAIRALGLTTLQIRSSECASACALAFLGGAQRFAEAGSIGVHRSSFSGDLGGGTEQAVSAIQSLTAHIISYMIEMGVDPGLLELSLATDSSDMRYLTSTEMRQYRVTSIGPDTGSAVSQRPAQVATVDPPKVAPVDVGRAVDNSTTRPDRLALYEKLDFVGRDISNIAVSDASRCAAACLGNGLCKAFTFNSKTRPGRGPNCFLKESQGQLDGNSSAVSGMFLRQFDPDAQTLMFGAIDPETNLYKDVDVPGFDLFRRPDANASTPFSCRLACVNDRRCAAFTFISKKKECWLKSGIGKARTLKGAITGAKAAMSFMPQIVRLD